MKLIEALQKWDKVTNDNSKTIYSTNSDGTIIMRTNGAGGGFKPTVELFTLNCRKALSLDMGI